MTGGRPRTRQAGSDHLFLPSGACGEETAASLKDCAVGAWRGQHPRTRREEIHTGRGEIHQVESLINRHIAEGGKDVVPQRTEAADACKLGGHVAGEPIPVCRPARGGLAPTSQSRSRLRNTP